jgi:hypothetical protein
VSYFNRFRMLKRLLARPQRVKRRGVRLGTLPLQAMRERERRTFQHSVRNEPVLLPPMCAPAPCLLSLQPIESP